LVNLTGKVEKRKTIPCIIHDPAWSSECVRRGREPEVEKKKLDAEKERQRTILGKQ